MDPSNFIISLEIKTETKAHILEFSSIFLHPTIKTYQIYNQFTSQKLQWVMNHQPGN